MARIEDIAQPTRDAVLAVPCPSFDTQPLVVGPPLAHRRIAIVSSAALIQRGDSPFRHLVRFRPNIVDAQIDVL